MLFPRFRLQVPLSVLSLLSIVLILGLAACADNSTPTPAATTPPSFTVGGTTVASTTVATTGGAVGSSFTATSGKFNLPGATMVTLDPALESAVKSMLSAGLPNIPDLSLTIYASNDEPSILGENADKALTTAGYTFHDVRGGQDSVLTIRDADGAGAYTKSGSPDMIIEARESSALTNINAAPPGISPDVYQKMQDQFKDKKSVLIVLSGTNLFQIITDARNNSPVVTNSAGVATATPGPTK